MSNSELKTVSIDSLVFLRRNPQYLTPHEMKALKASIERDGFLSPILVRPLPEGKHEVVSGNHRAMAAKELGHREIAAVVAEMDDSQAQRVAVNLNTVHGDPTAELLAPFLAEMSDDVLASVHLDEDLLKEVREFDAVLAKRLAEMEIPDDLNIESVNTEIGQCVCPTCGRRHIAGSSRKDE